MESHGYSSLQKVMKQKKLEELEKEQLIELLNEVNKLLDKKKSELIKTKYKLFYAQEKLRKMKVCVKHQRDRILQLYKVVPQLEPQDQ